MAFAFAKIASGNAGGIPVILAVYVYNFIQLQGYVVPLRFWWQVPMRYIVDFDYLTAPIIGFEPVEQIKFNPRVYGMHVVHPSA